MKAKLFHELGKFQFNSELDTMVDDYKKEVSNSPKDYYITPEMYDLLNNWSIAFGVSDTDSFNLILSYVNFLQRFSE